MAAKLNKEEVKKLNAAVLSHRDNLDAAVMTERVATARFVETGKAIQDAGKATRLEVEAMRSTFISYDLEPMAESAAVMVETINALHSNDKSGRDGRKKIYTRHFGKVYEGHKLVIEYNRSSRSYYPLIEVIDSIGEAVEKEFSTLQRLSIDYPTLVNLTVSMDTMKDALTEIITLAHSTQAARDAAATAAREAEAIEMIKARRAALTSELKALEAV